MLVARWAYTTITQFKPQGVGATWSLHTSLPMATCMAMGDEGSRMGSKAHVAETLWCIHIYTRIMPCMDTRMQDTEMAPHTHTYILYTCGSRELITQIILEAKVDKIAIAVDVQIRCVGVTQNTPTQCHTQSYCTIPITTCAFTLRHTPLATHHLQVVDHCLKQAELVITVNTHHTPYSHCSTLRHLQDGITWGRHTLRGFAAPGCVG